ncbi:MAG: ribokinase [Chloroflexi bacterium]|nr:ribokinase [Chloroflexota bacterium]
MASLLGGSVVVVGSCNMDMVTRAPRFPSAGEHLIASSFGAYLGGKGANQAVAAARAGADVAMIGRVGSDAFGTQMVSALAEAGIAVDAVAIDEEAPTGNASIWLDASGENRILIFPGANGRLSPSDIRMQRSRIGAASVLLAQLEVPIDTIAEACRAARGAGVRVVLNAAPASPLPADLWSLIDVLVVNQTEAVTLGGDIDAVRSSRVLISKGVGTVVVTLGGAGCIVMSDVNSGLVTIRSFPVVSVVDTTGAGDAFCGALAASLASGTSVAEAARVGNAAGSLAVEVLGALPSMPTSGQIQARLEGR